MLRKYILQVEIHLTARDQASAIRAVEHANRFMDEIHIDEVGEEEEPEYAAERS
jgi:hypothetical protein